MSVADTPRLPRAVLLFLIGLLAFMVFVPLLFSGYTVTDDIYFAMGFNEGWRSPWIFDARRSGRLHHVVSGQMMPLAYGWGYYWLSKAVAFSAIVANVVALFYMIRAIAADTRIAIVAVVFFFAFIQNTWDHNLLTAYPFIIHTGLTLFFVSVTWWWRALTTEDPARRRRLTLLSAAAFAISLFVYESLMPYIAVYPVLTFAAASGGWAARLRRAVRTPQVAVLVGFVALVVLFRVFLYTDEGRAFNAAQQYELNLEPVRVLKVLERYGASAMPMHYFRAYRDLVNDFYLGYGSPRSRLIDVFAVFDPAWMVKAAIVAFLVGWLLALRTRVHQRGALLLIALILLIGTNLPLAVTAKYQSWVIENFSHGYLTAYLVFFGVVILLALLVDSVVGVLTAKSRFAGRVAAAVFVVAAFVVSYGTDFLNAHVARTQQRMYDRWAAVDAWIASPAFEAMPDGSIVLATSLWDKPYEGQTTLYDGYWGRYVEHHGRKPVLIIRDRLRFQQLTDERGAHDRLYYLKLIQERRSDGSFLVFGRVQPPEARQALVAPQLEVLAHSKMDHLRVLGRLANVTEGCRARMVVDGLPSSGTFREGFAAEIDRRRRSTAWQWTHVASQGGVVIPESVTVVESSEPLGGDVDVEFGRGFYHDEFVRRWAGQQGEINVRNRGDRNMQVDLLVELHIPSAPAGRTFPVEVTAGERRQRLEVGEPYVRHAIRVDVPARTTVPVVFTTAAPPVEAPLDSRTLVMMFAQPVRVEEVSCATADAVTDTARRWSAPRPGGG
jgi:hypothetical protein